MTRVKSKTPSWCLLWLEIMFYLEYSHIKSRGSTRMGATPAFYCRNRCRNTKNFLFLCSATQLPPSQRFLPQGRGESGGKLESAFIAQRVGQSGETGSFSDVSCKRKEARSTWL